MSNLTGKIPARMKRMPAGAIEPTRRKTIAFFGSSPGGSFMYEKWLMWRGLSEKANEQGVNLLYIAGEELAIHHQAVLYDLIGSHNVDGLILWNTFVSDHSPTDRVQRFLSQYYPLPIVIIEREISGYPSVLVDNQQGMNDLLAHLVTFHNYRKIAFLSDRITISARERQQAFEQVMKKYNRYDPRLIGSFVELGERGLQPGLDYQAIVTNMDQSAVSLIETFQSRGIRVPEDVSVTGYNDGQEARGVMPPLTTVRLPFEKMGREAVDVLLKSIAGEPIEEHTCIPLKLVLRRSCGCIDPLAEQAITGPVVKSGEPFSEITDHHYEAIVAEIVRGMGSAGEKFTRTWAEKILNSFFAEIKSNQIVLPSVGRSSIIRPIGQGNFIQNFNEVLQEAVLEGINVNRWHEAFSSFRRSVLPHLDSQTAPLAEDLWQQARVLIGQTAARTEVHRNWQASRRAAVLREIEAALLITFDINELVEIMVAGFPRLGIRGCYLNFYIDPARTDGEAILMLAYQEEKRNELNPQGMHFLARQLVPPGWLPTERRYSLVVVALNFRQEQIGFIVFEVDPPEFALESSIIDALQTQLSNALKGVKLRQELQDAKQKAEEANQLKSRFLSMVSHELRTPLNLIVGLSEMALREQSRNGDTSIEMIRKYQQQIYVSGQHLDRLIRDVLDLARSQVGQMDLVCNYLDIRPVLLDAASMGKHLAEQKNLSFQTEIPDYLPRVWGDKTRLRQILLNLLSNAVKFTAHGKVGIRVLVEEDEILVSVHDMGLGIAPDEQAKIFDEFHQSERTTARGYGGIGLGLAITRRLVEMHGGRIWVSSSGEEGSGSTFTFTLPAIKSESDLPPETEITNSQKVLVLTKFAASVEKLVRYLEKQGFMVEEYILGNLEELITYIVASPPGALVLDLAPVSELGWDIIRALKEHPQTLDIPVLFFSLMMDQDAGSVIDMEYLRKPIGPVELVKTLERYGFKSTIQDSSRKILIIDDEPGILEMHARMVHEELPDCCVLSARNGREGLELMRQNLPELVLLDLMMPELDGFGVLEVIQEEQTLRNIPVVILTGQSLTEHDVARLNRGVSLILSKGIFTAKETLARIELVLNQSKRLGSEAQRLVRSGMAYIHEHYGESILRSEIANHLNINEQYLTRCFKKELGLSPMTYLNRYRIRQAKKLLEIGDKTITEVAMQVGFSSQSYFSRIFLRETGLSPRSYQRGERIPAPVEGQ